MDNLHGTIYALCEERGSLPAYRLQGEAESYRSVSWAEHRDRSLRLSAFLHARGVRAGDRVMLVSENGPEWTMAALAVLNLRAVLVPVAAISSQLEIENTFRSARPRLCIYSREIAAARHLEELLRAEGTEAIAWRLQDEQPLEPWIGGLAPHPIDRSAPEGETALLIYTSGTTGAPKAVPISHASVLANARAVLEVIEVSAADRIVSVLPLSHMLEFTGGFVLPTLIGASITYLKGLKPEDLLRALRDSRATCLIAVPLLYEVIARNLQAKLDALPGPLPKLFGRFADWVRAYPFLGRILFYPVHKALGGHVRFFVAGGSRLQPQTFDYFRGLGITILQGYGLTETAPVLTFTTLANAAPGHVGAALPGVTVGIFSDEGRRLGTGEEGEIWAKGPNVFAGYLDPEHSRSAFSGEWFRTGDLGSFDEQGLLRITGRKKDIIVTAAGKNVYPEENESLVLASGLFAEAAVLGLKDSAGHERVVLVVVPDRTRFPGKSREETEAEATASALELSRALADYKWPQKVVVLFEELPKTSTRKVKKHELRKLLERREAQAAGAADTPAGAGLDLANPLEAAIAQGIAEITKADPARLRPGDALIKDLGLDSLTFVELVGKVESRFGIRIDGIDFAAIETVGDLVTALQFAGAGARKASFLSGPFFADFPPGANSRPYWSLPRQAFNSLVRLMMRSRHGLEVEGLEHLEGGGPFVLTPNHSSHFDLLSIASAVPHRMVHRTYAVAAKDYFFNRTWKALAARLLVNAIPFDRKARVDQSMRRCREALDGGGSLVIFPEGTRSPSGTLQDFKPGVGQLLAGHPQARAIPVYIDGAHRIMPKGTKLPSSGKLRVRFGRPISFQDLPPGPESFRKIAERLRAEVVDLGRGRLQ